MFCSKCGFNNSDSAAFCEQCGSRLPKNAEVTNEDIYNEVHNNVSQNPVINLIKRMGTSPLFITAIISYSVYLFFNLIYLFTGYSSTMSGLYKILAEKNIPIENFDNILNVITGASTAVAFVCMIPSFLICAGMWVTYASAANKTNFNVSTTGLSIIKVITIISLIFVSISAALYAILSVLLIVVANSNSSYYSAEYPVIAIGVIAIIVIGIAIFTLLIVYEAKIIKTVRTIKNTVATGIASDSVSPFVAVMCYIFGGFSIIELLSTPNVYVIVSGIATATASICFGIFIFTYRNKMREIILTSQNIS